MDSSLRISCGFLGLTSSREAVAPHSEDSWPRLGSDCSARTVLRIGAEAPRAGRCLPKRDAPVRSTLLLLRVESGCRPYQLGAGSVAVRFFAASGEPHKLRGSGS